VVQAFRPAAVRTLRSYTNLPVAYEANPPDRGRDDRL